MADLVFFYGTLMTGFDRRRQMGIDPRMKYRTRGWVQAALFDLGIYPAAVPADAGRVWGELFDRSSTPRACCGRSTRWKDTARESLTAVSTFARRCRCTSPTARPSRRGSTSTTPRLARRRESIPAITWNISKCANRLLNSSPNADCRVPDVAHRTDTLHPSSIRHSSRGAFFVTLEALVPRPVARNTEGTGAASIRPLAAVPFCRPGACARGQFIVTVGRASGNSSSSMTSSSDSSLSASRCVV